MNQRIVRKKGFVVVPHKPGEYRQASLTNIQEVRRIKEDGVTYSVTFSTSEGAVALGRYENLKTALLVRDTFYYLSLNECEKRGHTRPYHTELEVQKAAIQRKRKDALSLLQYLVKKHNVANHSKSCRWGIR